MTETQSNGDPFQALADPNRRAIVEELTKTELSVQALADVLPISRPAVSRHLRILKDAGLVEDRPVGTRRLYGLRGEGVGAARDYLDHVWGEATVRFALLADNTQPTKDERS